MLLLLFKGKRGPEFWKTYLYQSLKLPTSKFD